MPRQQPRYWLIVWGSASHAIRTGHGTPAEVAFEAFGVRYDNRLDRTSLKTMTWQPVTTAIMHSDLKRTRACVTLLETHRDRGAENVSPDIQKHIDEIAYHWKAEWDRYVRRYGPIGLGPAVYFDGVSFKPVPKKAEEKAG